MCKFLLTVSVVYYSTTVEFKWFSERNYLDAPLHNRYPRCGEEKRSKIMLRFGGVRGTGKDSETVRFVLGTYRIKYQNRIEYQTKKLRLNPSRNSSQIVDSVDHIRFGTAASGDLFSRINEDSPFAS